ncbi:MAG: aminopeptidase P N-terminal domain-containing protein [Chloroherpetonaceae bacterium]|nr:aminopeptidase P N-terminal domain-containing protein [Chloroherpetonaceae bacterium]MDW8437353.1 aminopeptidase P N-terminal domain-containing protein [Chloroherpetonaceae bacterium]
MKFACLFLALMSLSVGAFAQRVMPNIDLPPESAYDPDRPPPSFHKQNRERFLSMLPDSSIAIFFANDLKTRNNDVEYLFRQSNSILYLTGLYDEPNAALLLSKFPMPFQNFATTEILFVQPRNALMETWTGRRLGPEGATQKLGVAAATIIDSLQPYLFNELLKTYRALVKRVFISYPAKDYADSDGDYAKLVKTIDARLREDKTLVVQNASPLLGQMRQIKHPIEIDLIQKATDATIAAHLEAIKSCEPNMREYELAAVAEYVFKKKGCEYVAYPSIVGAGENSVILHYNSTRKKILDGELVLMDMGGEYHGYATDITRTIPANGKFTPEQRAIYDLVLAAQDSAIAQCKPGNSFRAPHQKAVEVIAEGLLKLGLIQDKADYRRYFMHGTSHSVGLDVHDPGMAVLQAGQVLTVEPGIYIAEGSPCERKWWNIGVRIEDMILITETGARVMSAALPRKAEDIETLMKEKGIGNLAIK